MTAPFDLSVTDKLLSTTRAVRRRLDFNRPVEKEILLECIKLSQQAPTASNSQTWRWLVVMDKEKRKALGDIYRKGIAVVEESKANISPGDKQTQRVYDSSEYLLEHIHESPALVIACVDGRLPEDAAFVQQVGVYGSIFGAAWSFQLALRSRGLGSVFTCLHLLYEREVAELFGIPENIMQCALFPVAYTIGIDFKPADRPPPEEITYWDYWGN